jgi:hypothetical protein
MGAGVSYRHGAVAVEPGAGDAGAKTNVWEFCAVIDEERIGQALQALRGADDGLRTGIDAEARAILAFRRQHRRRSVQRLTIAAVVVVMCVAGIASYQMRQSRRNATARVDFDAARQSNHL